MGELELALRCIASECLDGTTPTAEGNRVREAADELERLTKRGDILNAELSGFMKAATKREAAQSAEIERLRAEVTELEDEARRANVATDQQCKIAMELHAALKRITECTEERDGGEGIQVISGSSREFWYAVIAAKELTHGRPAAKTSGVSSHGLGPISATDVAYLRGETVAKLLTGVAFLHRWMRTVNPLLGGVTPLDMIKAGRGEKLAAFIEEASEMNEATGEQP